MRRTSPGRARLGAIIGRHAHAARPSSPRAIATLRLPSHSGQTNGRDLIALASISSGLSCAGWASVTIQASRARGLEAQRRAALHHTACLNTVLCVYCLDRRACTISLLGLSMGWLDQWMTKHKFCVDSGCRDSPVACLYRLLSEQRHEFKTRRWWTPNGLDPTTEHTVTTPRGQPPLVTSTSASCPLRDSGPSRPRSRVEDTNGPPARRCSCKLRPTRKVSGESPMA